MKNTDMREVNIAELSSVSGGYLYTEDYWIYVLRDRDGEILGVIDNIDGSVKGKKLERLLKDPMFRGASHTWITLDEYIDLYRPELKGKTE